MQINANRLCEDDANDADGADDYMNLLLLSDVH